MSHLIFDKRDWRFLMHEHVRFERLQALPPFADTDLETLEAVFDEGVKFAVDRVAAVNQASDREGSVLVDGAIRTPAGFSALWAATRDGGWTGAPHSPEFGGMGLPYSIVNAVYEAFNAGCQAFTMFFQLTSGAGHLIESFGPEDLRRRFVEKMYSGLFGGTMCLTEPQAGSAVGDARTSAIPQPDGTFLIEGNKIFISGGDADFYANVVHLVLARVKGDPEGTRGLSLFAVPKHLVGDDGAIGPYNHVAVTGIEHKMGIHGSPTCAISFGADGPTTGYLVGIQGNGMAQMFQMMNEARITCGAQGVSLANAAYQQALAYARDRRQGPPLSDLAAPSVAIIDHPDVRRNLLMMKCYAEGTRALAAKAAFHVDVAMHGPPGPDKEKSQDALELMVPIVKAYSTDKAFRVCELAVQVFGGYGYCSEYPVEQYLRDAKISSIYEGTNGIQAMDLVGRKMRQKGGALFMGYVQELAGFLESIATVGVLEPVHKALSKAQGALGEVAFWLSSTAGKDRSLAMLQATPFLELFGDLMVGHVLAEQAAIAVRALEARCGSSAPTASDQEDAEVAFYAGKVAAARFFANEVLVAAPSKARAMTSGERAALDLVF